MKKINGILLSCLIGFLLCGCQLEGESQVKVDYVEVLPDDKDLRELAYEQLDKDRKRLVSKDWETGTIGEVILREEMGIIEDMSFIGQRVYLITLPLMTLGMPNELIVFLSMDSYELIGYGYIE